MKKKSQSRPKTVRDAVAPVSYDIRQVQIVPMNKCRQIFVLNSGLADKNAQETHIKSKFAHLWDDDTSRPLQIWRDGNNVFFNQVDTPPNYTKQPVANVFDSDEGCIYLGYKTSSGQVTEGYIIVGTGDFRNNTLGLRYWVLPGPDDDPLVIEGTGDCMFNIHSTTDFL